MWHCDQLERQGDGSVIARFVHPSTDSSPVQVRKARYLGGQEGIPSPGSWYALNEETGEFVPAAQAPTAPAPSPAPAAEAEASAE